MSKKTKIRIAIIDMNNGFPNQGMRGIQEILHRYRIYNRLKFEVNVFDIRQKLEIPDLSHHIYISTGGPGSPYEGEGHDWENGFFKLLGDLDGFNLTHTEKKFTFLICHSFQLACRKYNLGEVTKRKSTAFGIFPISLTPKGKKELVFNGLPNPFFSVDSRDWQVVKPNQENLTTKGAEILALEKHRHHVDLERCMMAIRFSPYMIGTQFHPEADPIGMKLHFSSEEKKELITKNHGKAKYQDMINSLENPNRIMLTQSIVLPAFLNNAIANLNLT